jgi:hypothetical protein
MAKIITTTIDPRIVNNVVDWADYMFPSIERFGVAARLMDESDWKNWASGLSSIASLASLGIPDAYQFDDWREWALRFNAVINQGS